MSARDSYIAGRKALESGDSEAAFTLIAAAVSSKPDNAGWRASLGALMMTHGRLEEAIAQLRRAVEDAPGTARFRILLGRALNEANQVQEARTALLSATEVEADSVAAWAALGKFSRDQGDIDTAKRAFARVVELDPHQVSGHTALAALAEEEGDSRAELHHRRIVAELKSDHVPSQVMHAATLMKAGRYAEARERYQRVATLQPGHPGASAVVDELDRWASSGRPEGGVVSVDYYDAVYGKDNHYQEDGAALEHASHFSLICDLLVADGAQSIFDLGCGPGQFAQYLRSRSSIPYVGVDYSQVAIRSAIDRRVPDTEFRVSDIVASSLEDVPPIASIVCTEVLEHVLDDEALIAKIPEGHPCYFSVPSFHTFGHVRHFGDAVAVRQRYSRYLDDFKVTELKLGAGKNRLYVFSGRKKSTPNVD
ncbi:hypothetical protein GCM10011512_16070 [Tersicoccus solisilvae]|uniref:Methyltransferase domain-containing protein n=1 Tax=Tersicoccus solisilvae TaxID=1882339 RepID=A0ABQ1P2I7_9MICC|nr:tetratricopeptide repeat protein [Tersicoccus solisilvae]GGC89909.1 hypothetical protein GCM10011512_16070 [Tersicoccus solisilvae]